MESEVFTGLFDVASEKVETAFSDFGNFVIDPDGDFTVKNINELKLVDEKDNCHYTTVRCQFDNNRKIVEARLDLGQQAGPMLGKGFRVTYKDGVYSFNEWIS